jgi:hypothetical protein
MNKLKWDVQYTVVMLFRVEKWDVQYTVVMYFRVEKYTPLLH